MKTKTFVLVSWLFAVVSLVFAIIMGVNACNSRTTSSLAVVDASDVSALGEPQHAHIMGPIISRFGANFVEAGVDSGFIPDGGSYITWTLSTPITPPFGDQPITGIELRAASLDLVGGTATFYVASVGGDVNKTRVVVVPLSAAQELSFTTSAKNAVATGLGVTFQ